MNDDRLRHAYRAGQVGKVAAHLTEDEWTALMLDELTHDARVRALNHVMTCGECAAVQRGLLELAAESTSIDPGITVAASASRVTTLSYWVAGLAAAAVLVIGIRIIRPAGPAIDQDEVVRTTAVVAPIEITTPAGGWPLQNRRIEWRAITAADSYEIRINSADGAEAWRAQVTAPTAAVPTSVALRGRYYLQVTASRDGAVIASSPLVLIDVE